MPRLALGTRAARRTMAAGRRLAKSVKALTEVPELLRRRAVRQADRLRGQLAYEQMRTTPLDALRRVTNRSLKLAELREAGWTTVEEVLRADPEALQAVHGIGPKGAEAIREAATALLGRTEQELSVRIDPDIPSQDSEDLLRTLRMLLDFGAESRGADRTAARLAPVLPDAIRQAKPAGSWMRMRLSREANKQAAAAALDQLREILDDPQTAQVEQVAAKAVGAAHKAERMPGPVLWSEYQRNAASYTTLLGDLDRRARHGDGEAAHGYLPEELASQAGQTHLDTTLLKVRLRAYQAFGARFILARGRCVLGDEMGLGKTVQAIAVLSHVAATGGRHFLVICPASVVMNWIGEVAAHSTLNAYHLHGATRETETRRWLFSGGVAVTTFETLRRLPMPTGFSPDFVVVDEAHYIKNPETQRTQAVTSVAERAGGVLMMTGTPLENKVEEFRDLIGYLDADVADAITASDGTVGAKEFRRLVAPVYLRRNQEDVLTELPDSIELEEWVVLNEADERTYSTQVGMSNFVGMRRATVVNGRGEPSAKLERLVELVTDCVENGWKVIVFSFFLDVLAEVDEVLAASGLGVRTFQLSGRVSVPDRQAMVDEFSAIDGTAVLISQITAGGVGLNVQAASVVIFTEPQLKPTIEQQAIARCKRMGQTRRVRVHRLLAKDTVDSRILEILEAKSELIDAYARDSDAKLQDPAAIDGRMTGDLGSDGGIPAQLRANIVTAERQRLGLAS